MPEISGIAPRALPRFAGSAPRRRPHGGNPAVITLSVTAMPPIHPDVVHFAIALVLFAFAADLVGFLRGSAAARTIGWWSLVWGAVAGLVTAAAGFVDLDRARLTPETRALVGLHWRMGVVAVALVLVAVAWRARLRRTEPARTPFGYLAFLAFVCATLAFQGWFGGELAYTHGAGVAAANQGMVDPARAARRIDPVVRVLRHMPGFASTAAAAAPTPPESTRPRGP